MRHRTDGETRNNKVKQGQLKFIFENITLFCIDFNGDLP